VLPRGADALLSVHAIGSAPLAYQWRRTRVPLADATNSVWTRTNVQCGDRGGYDVVVTNALGSVTSSVVLLAVVSPVVFVASPADQIVAVGQTTTFSASATNDCGGSTPTYQWQHAGTNLAGATTKVLSIASAQFTNEGAYTVLVTNLAGAVTSSVAVLQVTTSLLALSPPSLDFGTVFCGLTTSASFVVSNAGIGLLSGTATILGGPFSLEPGKDAGLAIPVLGWTNLVVQFTPPAAGVFSNVIVFATDGGNTTNSLYGVGADLPVFLRAAQVGASVVFHFPTVVGKNYTLEYKDSLDNQAWLPFQSLVGDGGTQSFTNSTMMPSQRFYRLSAH
jgi:hypothetical protein